MKRKRKKVRVTPTKGATKSDLMPRLQTACAFWQTGEFQQAADLFRELLESDRGDPCFSRYWRASCLFQLGSAGELDALLQQHDDHSGIWRFAQALEAFRLHGDTEDAQSLLVEAHRLEPEFEHYLLRDKAVDARREVRFDAGAAERAFGCARLFLPAWRGVPGAAAWARRVLKVPPTSADPGHVPRPFPRDELRALPLRDEIWQVGLAPHPHGRIADNVPMWLLGVANVGSREMRALTIIDQPLTETVVWNQIIESCIRPIAGEPARPSTLVVCRPEFHDAWEPLLSEVGSCCRFENDPQPVTGVLEGMARELKKRALPPAEGIDIRTLPQSDGIWQADFFRSPAWVMNEQEGSYRPWSVLVLDKLRSIALTTSHTPGDPAPEMLLEFLVRTMARPGGGPAQRPQLVEVSDSDYYDHLRPRLEAAGVACRLVDELKELDDFCLRLAKSFDGSGKCSLAAGKGVTRAQMKSFYEAAEHYFRKAPWSRLPGELPIQIRCIDPAVGTRYAVVLGRTGVQLGLCVYDDWKITRAMLSGYADPEENRGLAVCYDEAEIMSAVDLHLVERLGWPIATPEAWPAAMRIEPQHMPRSPSSEELVFLDACLRAIPAFIEANLPAQIRQVATSTRSVELHLAWKT